MTDSFKELLDKIDATPAPAAAPAALTPIKVEHRHPCFECNGTGIYKGVRLHQEKSHCFACKGKGYFKKSHEDRQRARQKSVDRKQRQLEEAKAAFSEANPGLIEKLAEISSWHQFAATLLASFAQWGSLTDRQTAAAWASIAKVEAKRAEREADKASKSGDVGVENIETLFRTALGNGLKRPRFVTDRLVITPAKATGVNPGALYVKCDGAYAGKIVGGKLLPTRDAPKDILALVREIAEAPLESAKKYGRATGTCCCCGRTLTDPISIEAGIGPVCQGRWF